MNYKINISFIVYSLITCCTTIDLIENRVLDYLIDHIQKTPEYRLITIHSKTPEKLSHTSGILLRRISNEFPTLTINTSEVSSNKSNSQRLLPVKKWLRSRSQRKSLNILIADSSHEQNVTKALTDYITFLVNFSFKIARSQCIFFLVNYQGNVLHLQKFLEFSWSHKFLDVAVIELVKPMDPRKLFVPFVENSTILVHQFNPFTKTYYRQPLLERAKEKHFFVDKLHDLYGHTLYTVMFDEIPMVMTQRNYSGNEVWNKAHGLDVAIIKTLSKKMNFTTEVRVVYSDNPNERFNLTDKFIHEGLLNETLDFVVNFYAIIGSKPSEALHFKPSISLYPFSTNLIVKQYGKPIVKVGVSVLPCFF